MDTLNLVEDDPPSIPRKKAKGGRWTDRLKANRKRKAPQSQPPSGRLDDRPQKRRRLVDPASAQKNEEPAGGPAPRVRTQIISSLFTSNPAISPAPKISSANRILRPSNAPLQDASSFSGLGLDPLLVAHLETKMAIANPTSIQQSTLSTLLPTISSGAQPPDIFIQSQTGSGKTLSFLLPILHDLLPLSAESYIDRSIGTLAIIMAPTRELAQQISDVLENLLKLRLRPQAEQDSDDVQSARLTRFLVSGLLVGGKDRKHEKARLRKGLPIVVSTPGRLLDHLQKTSSFAVGKCRWLVLDEADRLLELGFEDTITGVIKSLDGQRSLAKQAADQGLGMDVRGWDWKRERSTILCSATIRDDVQKLAGATLRDPVVIKALSSESNTTTKSEENSRFTAPSQLTQKYIVCPLKLRLVVLVALLRSLIAKHADARIVVFFSCTDSVDFHWKLISGSSLSTFNEDDLSNDDSSTRSEEKDTIIGRPSLLPNASLFRLHGGLSTPSRLETFKQFSSASKESILFCTSVASRGLDLPLVQAVVQYDLPTEGGSTEYLHRVGRTARAGKGGEAWAFVSPQETEWVQWLEKSIASKGSSVLSQVDYQSILQTGFGGGAGKENEERASKIQNSFERWVLQNKASGELARKAYQSHMRAYTTHPSSEKHIFNIRELHKGHLAKAFALRDAPGEISSHHSKSKSALTKNLAERSKKGKSRQAQAAQLARLNAQRTSDYQIANTDTLEKMLSR